jgi:hypothetical protein
MANMKLTGGKKPVGDRETPTPSVLTESITPTPETKLADSKSKAMDLPVGNEADMQKVRDYQTKLNAKGANLKVDGMWGDKTAAASREYYNKYQKPQGNSRPMKIGNNSKNKEFQAVTPKVQSKAVDDFESNNKKEKVEQIVKPLKLAGRAKVVDDQISKMNSLEYNETNNFQNKFAAPRKRQAMRLTNPSTPLSIDERKKADAKDNQERTAYFSNQQKEKDSRKKIEDEIDEARKSGNTMKFNKLVNANSKK